MNKTIYTAQATINGQPIEIAAKICTGCVSVDIANTAMPKGLHNPVRIMGDSALHVLMELQCNPTYKTLPDEVQEMVKRGCLRLNIHHIHQLFGEA